MNARKINISDLKLAPDYLVELIKFVEDGIISNLAAKDVLTEMLNSQKRAKDVIVEKNLAQVSDTGELEKLCEEVIQENEKTVLSYKAGKENALMFLVGQVMKKSQGKANPKIVQEILRRRI